MGELPEPGLSGDVGPDPDGSRKRVVLDWTGGHPSFLDDEVSPIDFARMFTPDDESLGEYAEEYRQGVLERVEGVLSAIHPASFEVEIGEADSDPGATVVYFTGDIGPSGASQAGQTRLDQCDLQEGGDVVVWAGSLLELRDTFEFEEWVHLLANVAAHEVGHTVGFFHPDAFMADLSDYERATEVMMGVRTLSALRGPQHFLIAQETCPDSIASKYGGVGYGLVIDQAWRPSAKAALTSSRTSCTCRIVGDIE